MTARYHTIRHEQVLPRALRSPTESVQTGNHEQSSIRPESFDVGKMWQSHNPHQPTHAVQSRALTSVTHEALPSSRTCLSIWEQIDGPSVADANVARVKPEVQCVVGSSSHFSKLEE